MPALPPESPELPPTESDVKSALREVLDALISAADARRQAWCPKYRRSVLVKGVDVRLKEIIQAVAAECNSEILELEVMPDHVHLLVEVDPQFGIHRLIKLMKGKSSKLIREEFKWIKLRLPTLWTNSYFVSTIGGAPLEVVKQYIEQQKHK